MIHTDTDRCLLCGHERQAHGQERKLISDTESRRELCLECDGYEEPGYPSGKAWHRFWEAARV